MDIQRQRIMTKQRWHLETMLEETEPEEETQKRETGEAEEGETEEEEDEDVQTEGVVEPQEAMAEEESEDEEDAHLLRVMRPRRQPQSLRLTESFSETPSSSHCQEETESFSESDPFSSVGLSSVAATSGAAKKMSVSRKLRVKVSKDRWEKYNSPVFIVQKPPMQWKGGRKRTKKSFRNKNISELELFPQWLMDVMVNIEEAKTHQLVIE
ncbi:uncharacterized protein LOC141804081 [Halichoeres trimaculatus]|uniref:uncharacterized protein LOC141804081 n=1 Tax=Halichoeres trimaculatus TaxID=147232 RepID=UPI003D9E33EA